LLFSQNVINNKNFIFPLHIVTFLNAGNTGPDTRARPLALLGLPVPATNLVCY
jgi:hypothetical protein